MNKTTIAMLAALLMLNFACGGSKQANNPDSESSGSIEKKEGMKPEKQSSLVYTLSPKHAGEFHIGKAIPLNGAKTDYVIQKKVNTLQSEGESYEELTYEASYEGKVHLILLPYHDYTTGTHYDDVDEIRVVSPLYRTAKGIGVGSSIPEFQAAYPDAKSFYTYVSGMCWLESADCPNMQFLLDKKQYSENIVPNSDLEKLDPEKFKSGTKIIKVRILPE